jgi:F-type H+-transporting ATPase subunit b
VASSQKSKIYKGDSLKLKYLAILLLPVLACASGSAEGSGETDIVPRVINFSIFASILYYLLANPIKEYFSGRTNEIADRLSAIQDKLKESEEAKKEAQDKLKDSDNIAVDLVNTAKSEADMLVAKIEENSKINLENLKKSHDDRIEIEEKKMTKEVVTEIVDGMFNDGKIDLDSSDLLNIIKKKVA